MLVPAPDPGPGPAPRRRVRWTWLGALAFAATVAAWILYTVRAAHPGSSTFPLFHSDDAIPVLMANDGHFNPFSLYFYGQDRFGAWPFLAARLIRSLTGLTWTPAGLAAMEALWVCAVALPLSRLVPGERRLAAVGYLALLSCIPTLRLHLFELAQVYPWQLGMLVWAWYGLRRLADAPRARPGALLIAFVPSALATWSSPLSGPLLLAIAAVEALPKLADRRPSWRERAAVALRGFGVAGAAIVTELALRASFHRFSGRRYGWSYETNLEFTPRAVPSGLAALGAYVWKQDRWVLALLGVALAAALVEGARLLRAGLAQPWRWLSPSPAMRVVLGGLALAALALLAPAASAHVRDNGYDPRYVTPTCFFLALAAIAAVARLVERWVPSNIRLNVAVPGALAVCSALLLNALPGSPRNPSFEKLREAARAMEQARGRLLLGGYWGTYAFAALASPGALAPLPQETQYQRTPWITGPERPDGILLTDYQFDGFGAPGNPDAWISDRKRTYRRATVVPWTNGLVSFWSYREQPPVPVTFAVSPEGWSPAKEPLTVMVPMFKDLSLILFLAEGARDAAKISLVSAFPWMPRRPVELIEKGQHFVRYRIPSLVAPMKLEITWPGGGEHPLRDAVIVAAP